MDLRRNARGPPLPITTRSAPILRAQPVMLVAILEVPPPVSTGVTAARMSTVTGAPGTLLDHPFRPG